MDAKEARETLANTQISGNVSNPQDAQALWSRVYEKGYLEADAQWRERVKALVEALEKIEGMQLRPELGQIVDSEHYEAAWLDCAEIARITLAQFRKDQEGEVVTNQYPNRDAMTNKERADELKAALPCTCIDAYKKRGLAAPDCPQCQYLADILDVFERALDEAEKRHHCVVCYIGGMKEMRERAATEAEDMSDIDEGFGGGCDCARYIRALPLEGGIRFREIDFGAGADNCPGKEK